MPRPHPCTALLALGALLGCEFFVTSPPDPALDGVLACGESEPLAGLTDTDSMPVDAEGQVGLHITTDFDDADVAGVLEVRGDDGPRNIAELWDPESGGTMLATTLEPGEEARVVLSVAAGGVIAGTLRMSCPAAEVCYNLDDDNGDGRLDCGDPLCARTPDCVTEQATLATAAVSCGTTYVPVEAPVLRAFDDQRTLYTNFPLGESLPFESFWRGAELALTSPEGSMVTVRSSSGGLVCPGTVSGDTVFCDGGAVLASGDEVTVPGGTDLFLEPLGPVWEALEVLVLCSEERR